jgi:hypothetical protein
MSVYPLKGCLNGRPKLIFLKKDTGSFITTGQTNQIISQLLSIRLALNISFPGLLRRESYTTTTTVFKPLVRGFSTLSAGSAAESGQERETPSMRNFYE